LSRSGSGRRVHRQVRAIAEPIDEEGDHAPRVVGPVIVGGHAQARDGAKDIVGIDIGADLAGRRRRLKKRTKGGPEPLIEIPAQGFEGRVSGVQSRGEPAFGRDEGRVALHPSRQRLAGLVLGRKNRRRVRAGIDFATKDSRDEVGALWKMSIKGADAYAGLLCDLTHRSVNPSGREHRLGRPEQRVEATLGVGANPPIRAASRLQTIAFVVRFVAHHDPTCQTEHCSVYIRNAVPFEPR
jgi:hypothetical protein